MSSRTKRKVIVRKKRIALSPARWVAYQTLRDWAEGRGFAEDLLERNWRSRNLRKKDLRLSQELVYGVFRRMRLLDFWIDRLAREGISSLPEELVDCLRLGLYQLAFLDRIPPHAAINESVLMSRAVGLGGLSRIVNAVLRNFRRREEDLTRAHRENPNRLALETSHPDWLVEWAVARWGEKKAEIWLRWNNTTPRIHLRPVVSRWAKAKKCADPQDAVRGLAESVNGAQTGEDATTVVLPPGSSPSEIKEIRNGSAFVQDPSAGKAVRMLQPRAGERIYDLCAAPGGKTLQIADETRGQSEMISIDSSSIRLRKVRQNLNRCGFYGVAVFGSDLMRAIPSLFEPGHAVLLDVPCSGLGTLRRRVDLRYRMTPEQVRELAAKAKTLLGNAAVLVRPGGRLVYSTCTLTEQENGDVVRSFLESRGDTWELKEEKIHPEWLASESQGIPDPPPDCDGAYTALLVRRR